MKITLLEDLIGFCYNFTACQSPSVAHALALRTVYRASVSVSKLSPTVSPNDFLCPHQARLLKCVCVWAGESAREGWVWGGPFPVCGRSNVSGEEMP